MRKLAYLSILTYVFISTVTYGQEPLDISESYGRGVASGFIYGREYGAIYQGASNVVDNSLTPALDSFLGDNSRFSSSVNRTQGTFNLEEALDSFLKDDFSDNSSRASHSTERNSSNPYSSGNSLDSNQRKFNLGEALDSFLKDDFSDNSSRASHSFRESSQTSYNISQPSQSIQETFSNYSSASYQDSSSSSNGTLRSAFALDVSQPDRRGTEAPSWVSNPYDSQSNAYTNSEAPSWINFSTSSYSQNPSTDPEIERGTVVLPTLGVIPNMARVSSSGESLEPEAARCRWCGFTRINTPSGYWCKHGPGMGSSGWWEGLQ